MGVSGVEYLYITLTAQHLMGGFVIIQWDGYESFFRAGEIFMDNYVV